MNRTLPSHVREARRSQARVGRTLLSYAFDLCVAVALDLTQGRARKFQTAQLLPAFVGQECPTDTS
jgi:hypothetical protein